MSSPWLALQGASALMKTLERKKQEYADRLEAAATAGALVVEGSAKDKAPYKTGTLKRSIAHETIEKSAKACHVAVGTDLEYAAAQEFGYESIPAHPYLRPALDETKAQVTKVIGQVMKGD